MCLPNSLLVFFGPVWQHAMVRVCDSTRNPFRLNFALSVVARKGRRWWSPLSLSITNYVVNLHTSRNVNKTHTIENFDPATLRHCPVKTANVSSEVVSRHLDVAVGALMLISSSLSVLKKIKQKGPKKAKRLSEACQKCLIRLKGRHRLCVGL